MLIQGTCSERMLGWLVDWIRGTLWVGLNGYAAQQQLLEELGERPGLVVDGE